MVDFGEGVKTATALRPKWVPAIALDYGARLKACESHGT